MPEGGPVVGIVSGEEVADDRPLGGGGDTAGPVAGASEDVEGHGAKGGDGKGVEAPGQFGKHGVAHVGDGVAVAAQEEDP